VAAGSISPAFVAASVAAFNGSTRATTFVSATELQVQMLMSDVMTAGTINVTVSTPVPGGGVASAQFTVTDPPNAANFPQVISVNAAGGAANGASSSPAMSADGRYVAFLSTATNLVPVGKLGQVFVRDTCLGTSNCYPTTYPVDVTPQQGAPNGSSFGNISISEDGRFVAFTSYATNLVSADTNESTAAFSNVFVRDTCFGGSAPKACVPNTSAISVDAFGNPGSLGSDSPSMSGDGRFVAFRSSARDLVTDGSAARDIFVRDTCEGVTLPTTCVPRTVGVSADVLVDGEPATFPWSRPAISSQGRYVVFDSTASTDSITNGFGQVFLSDLCLGTSAPAGCVPKTTLITASDFPKWGYANGQSASVSEDGRFVVFRADKVFLNAGQLPLDGQVFIHDTCLGLSAPVGCSPSTALVAADSAGSPANAKCLSPRISPSGRFVSFTSSATNLDAGVTVPSPRAFVRDTCFGAVVACTPRAVAIAPSESETMGTHWLVVPVTSDGRFAAFYSVRAAASLPSSGLGDVFLTVTPFQLQQ
jgi:Tol biopolymer transport system component